jgi:phosphatidylglycerophosphatase C
MTTTLRQPEAPRPAVAAFDFDGTLTWRDSFIAFLSWRAGPAGFAFGAASLAPAALAYGLWRDRGRFKEAAARRFMKGAPRAEIEDQAARFCEQRFDKLIRPDALDCWRDWRARGAMLIIVTASPEMVVAPFARALGADGLIGTRLEVDEDDRLTGRLVGANCRAEEKVARLRALLGENPRLTAAYGDTAGDREMLSIAETAGYQVFKGRP